MSEQVLTEPTEGLPLPAPNEPEPLSMGAVLRIVTMRRLWYAQIVSVFGDFLALFAVITVMTFKLHATAQQVTAGQIAYLLPIALLGIVSGVFVDRWPVKITLVSSAMIGLGLLVGISVLNAVAKNVKNTTLVYSGLGGIALATLLMATSPSGSAATLLGSIACSPSSDAS